MTLQQFRDVRFERHQVRRVLGVAADRDRAGHVAMDESKRAAEEVNPRGDDRGADAVVVDDERLDEIVEVALVVRNVDRPSLARRFLGDADVLLDALDLAKDGIERMLERAIDRIPLRGAQLVEIGVDPLARLKLGLAVASTQVARDVLARQHCLGDVVEHSARTI